MRTRNSCRQPLKAAVNLLRLLWKHVSRLRRWFAMRLSRRHSDRLKRDYCALIDLIPQTVKPR